MLNRNYNFFILFIFLIIVSVVSNVFSSTPIPLIDTNDAEENTSYSITIDTNPAGLIFEVDSVEYTAPYTFQWSEGETYLLSAPSPQDSSSEFRYAFNNWEDGGEQTHIYTVPDYDDTLTVHFKKQFKLAVVSLHGNPQGAGWYDADSSAIISVSTPVIENSVKYIFDYWMGDHYDSTSTATVVMNTSKTVYAVWAVQYFLTTGIIPDASGTITPSPPGQWVDAESDITVSASSYSGYEFIGWSGSVSGEKNPLTITMSEPETIYANFGKKVYITINTQPPGLQFYANAVLYTAPHTFFWTEGSLYYLKAESPQPFSQGSRYVFSSWSDGADIARTYQVPGTNDNLSINFKKQYYLSLDTPHGNPQGEGWYDENKNVSFSVTTPEVDSTTRYLFNSWGGDYSGTTPSGSVTMNSPKIITASWDTQYYLTLNSPYGNPQGEKWYDSGATASFSLTSPIGDDFTRYFFDHWSGDYSGTETSGSVIMNDAKIITAHWIAQHYLSLSELPDEGGNISHSPPGSWYEEDSEVELNASAAEGYRFTGWSGDLSGSEGSVMVTMSEPKDIAAHFKKEILITITTDPHGLKFTADDTLYTDSHTFTWLENSQHYLDADSVQSLDNTIRYKFYTWSNQAEKRQLYTVPLTNSTVTVRFYTQYYLTVNSSYGNPEGEGWYNRDSTAVISVDRYHYDDQTRHKFVNWSDDVHGDTSVVVPLIMDSPKMVTANWQKQYHLTVDNSGYGIARGDGWYDEGSEAVFSIAPPIITMEGDSQYVFIEWIGSGKGAYSGGDISHNITINNPVSEKAHWDLHYKVTTSTVPAWGGSIQFSSGNEWYNKGERVTVTAIPAGNTDYEFSYWSGDLSGNANPENIIIDNPKNICAHFIIRGTVTVTTDPEGIPITVDDTDYISPKQFKWISGTIHTIGTTDSYSPLNGVKFIFDEWNNKGKRIQTIEAGVNSLYRAIFMTKYYLSTAVTPPEGGEILPESDWFYKDSIVTVQVSSEPGFEFVNWKGDLTGSYNPDEIIMSSPRNITAEMRQTTGIGEAGEIPTDYILKQNQPNPFNPETMIAFSVPQNCIIELSVYNTRGQHIRTLCKEVKSRGKHTIIWDGTNDVGEDVSSGIYFYILRTDEAIKKRKCILLR